MQTVVYAFAIIGLVFLQFSVNSFSAFLNHKSSGVANGLYFHRLLEIFKLLNVLETELADPEFVDVNDVSYIITLE